MSSASPDDDLEVDVKLGQIWYFTEPNSLLNYRGEIIARVVV